MPPRPLEIAHLDPDPLVTLSGWIDEAYRAGEPEPGQMILATVDGDGQPQARAVLLRAIHEGALHFYTNRESAKARDLAARPRAAATFGWPALLRQVRVTGPVSELSGADSDAYFASRPRESQLGAWASPQSEVIVSREALDERLAEVERRFAGGEVPRPPFWGGYAVLAVSVEFWQGRPGRLHDRLRWRRAAPQEPWTLERLAP
jgi:pyridoxamine 5'-phosphate oxidase